MRRGRLGGLALSCLLVFSCAQPYDLTNDLGGRTLSYDQNVEMEILGLPFSFKQETTFQFNDEGKKGLYEISILSYGYPSQSAADAALISGKDWFRSGGERGSFEYDAATLMLTTSVIDVWATLAGTTTSFAADYGYRPYHATVDPECSSASRTVSQAIVFDQDNMNAVFAAKEDAWVHTATTAETSIVAGAASPTVVTSETYAWRLAESAAGFQYALSETSTLNAVSWTASRSETSTYAVTQVFQSGGGGGEGGASFATIWKDGKSATFGLERTAYAEIGTAPGVPEASEPAIGADGTGLSGTRGVDSWWYADLNRQAPFRQSFTRRKGYIVSNESLAFAGRGLDGRAAEANHE